MSNKPFIKISIPQNAGFQTEFRPYTGIDTIAVGVALASAARVISEAFKQQLLLSEHQRDEILAQIRDVFVRDINEFGSLGEEESVKTK